MGSPKKQTTVRKFILFIAILLGVMALVFALIQTLLAGYGVAWTGFGDYASPQGDYVRGKTLWDWLELLIIPVFLAVGVFILQRSEGTVEREIATDRQQEAALQAYLDRMADLLLKEKLLTSENEEVWNVARVRTLTVLRGLNAARNNIVLRFLRDIGLAGKQESKLFVAANLEGADLKGVNLIDTNLEHGRLDEADLERAFFISANLKNAILRNTNLQRANLNGTNLYRAVLRNARLQSATLYHANLHSANLEGSNLEGANLQDANLEGVNLRDANLKDAFLRKANLKGAQVTGEQLVAVKSLEGAIMPDGTKHD